MTDKRIGSAKSILIVDDIPDNLDLLKGVLGPHYGVKVAISGRVALKIAASSHPPDLILLDIMMPDMDGYEVCRLLKASEATRNIPIIFVTAKAEVDDETLGFALGAEDYITKPISPSVVLARVKTHLALYDQKKLLEDQVQVRTAELMVKNIELDETRIEVISQLGRAAEYRDDNTGMHIQRMSRFSRLLGLSAGLSEEKADMLMYASMMHDIGKIGIPDGVLLKPGKLTDMEFETIKKHPEIGAIIIGEQRCELLQQAREICLCHHEKWNGQGYPKGTCGEAIPLSSRIAAIADVFDALTSRRPYKDAWPVDKALALIAQQAGEHFDPGLTPLFVALKEDLLAIMGQYPDENVPLPAWF
ncbi:MAG: two-component system response regulator [Alphaproteobacteria bacterium]|nr:two-component system response regulator [Alphaproteobacteria bacterium]